MTGTNGRPRNLTATCMAAVRTVWRKPRKHTYTNSVAEQIDQWVRWNA